MKPSDYNDGPFPKSVFPPSVFPRRIFPWMGGDDEDDPKPTTPDGQRKKDDDDEQNAKTSEHEIHTASDQQGKREADRQTSIEKVVSM